MKADARGGWGGSRTRRGSKRRKQWYMAALHNRYKGFAAQFTTQYYMKAWKPARGAHLTCTYHVRDIQYASYISIHYLLQATTRDLQPCMYTSTTARPLPCA